MSAGCRSRAVLSVKPAMNRRDAGVCKAEPCDNRHVGLYSVVLELNCAVGAVSSVDPPEARPRLS